MLTYLAYELLKLHGALPLMQVEEKARAAYLQGAEEHPRATLGRPLTHEELERVLRRYSRG